MTQPTAIKPLTDFLRNFKAYIGRLKSSGEAEVLTVNGKASIVVQDAKSYYALYELAERARQDERLRLAIQSVIDGKPAGSAGEVFIRLRNKHIPSS